MTPDGDAAFTVQFVGTKRDPGGALPPEEKMGVVLSESAGVEATYTLAEDDLYVRAVVTSSAGHVNPSFKEQKKQAWTQPVGWKVE